MLDEERLKELSSEYDTSIERIKSYCEELFSYPFVRNGDDEYIYECLEAILSYREDEEEKEKLSVVERCVYRIYGDETIPYLSNKFKKKH